MVRVRWGDRDLTVVGVHVPPPVPPYGQAQEPTILAVTDWVSDGRLVQGVGPGQVGDPVVLLGDFNALPWSADLDPVERAGLGDAWQATRRVPGPTWGPVPGGPCLARIDYVFTSQVLPALGCWTLDLPGSDHATVVAELGPAGTPASSR